MAGTMKPELLDEKKDVNGTTFEEAANSAGYGGASHKVHFLLLTFCPAHCKISHISIFSCSASSPCMQRAGLWKLFGCQTNHIMINASPKSNSHPFKDKKTQMLEQRMTTDAMSDCYLK